MPRAVPLARTRPAPWAGGRLVLLLALLLSACASTPLRPRGPDSFTIANVDGTPLDDAARRWQAGAAEGHSTLQLLPQGLESLAARCEQERGVRPTIRDLKPMDGVEFGYALNLSRCVGCRKCAHACLSENNQSRDSADDIEMSYIRVLEMNKGAINLETSNVYYNPDTVPQKDKYYMPV